MEMSDGEDFEEPDGIFDEEEEIEEPEIREGFIQTTLSPGALLLITATMRAGKTNQASNIMERAVPESYNVYTNIQFFKDSEIDEAIQEGLLKFPREHYWAVPKEIHTVTKASELILGLYQTRKNITILDEAMFYAGSKRGASKELRWFEEFVTQIGKLDSSLILICQVKSKLAKMLKEDLPSYELKIYKYDSGKRAIDVYYNEPGESEIMKQPIDHWDDIPASHYPFDTKAPAGFDFDINMEQFINMISKLNSLNTRKAIPGILDELLFTGKKIYKKPDKKKKKDFIIEILRGKKGIKNKEVRLKLKDHGIKCSDTHIDAIRRELTFEEPKT